MDEFFSDAIVTIDNATDTDRLFDLTAVGIPGDQNSDYCVENGPASIQVEMSNPISVPAGQSIEVPLVIDRPGGLIEDGDRCWTAYDRGSRHGHGHAAQGDRLGCRRHLHLGSTNGVLPMLVGEPTPVKLY